MLRITETSPDTSRRIFGRDRELSLLAEIMSSGGPHIIHIHGISGIGKSALIRAFAANIQKRSRLVVCLLDGRAIEPTERGFLQELSQCSRLGHPTLPRIWRALSARTSPILIVIDSYELLGLLDAWLRQTFMARLRGKVRLVVASRFPPAPQWTESPDWREEFRALHLQPLSHDSALELLATLGTHKTSARQIAKVAHGHPLALVIGGAAATGLPSTASRTAHGAVSILAQRFLAQVEDPHLQEALRAASVARRVTRSLLRALMPRLADDSLFDRLIKVPFVEPAHDGLMIHDAVRESIRADLEAIDPKAFQGYRRAAWQQLNHEAQSSATIDLWRYTADLIFLIENPVVREAFFPEDVAKFYVERARASDASSILEIAAMHDGVQGVTIVERWLRHMPHAFYVIRDAHAQNAGFYYLFDPSDAVPSLVDSDPVTSAWAKHLKRNPLPKDQNVLFLRRWLSRKDGEAPSAVQAAAWLDIKRHYMERRPFLQRVYLTLANVSPYADVADDLGFRVVNDIAVILDGETFSSLELDMGPRSVDGWLTRLVAAELGAEQDGLLDERRKALILNGQPTALTRKEFEVMRYFTLRPNEVIPRSQLLNDVWGVKYSGGNVVDALVASLRRKLGKTAYIIETIHGHGYLYRNPALFEAAT